MIRINVQRIKQLEDTENTKLVGYVFIVKFIYFNVKKNDDLVIYNRIILFYELLSFLFFG